MLLCRIHASTTSRRHLARVDAALRFLDLGRQRVTSLRVLPFAIPGWRRGHDARGRTSFVARDAGELGRDHHRGHRSTDRHRQKHLRVQQPEPRVRRFRSLRRVPHAGVRGRRASAGAARDAAPREAHLRDEVRGECRHSPRLPRGISLARRVAERSPPQPGGPRSHREELEQRGVPSRRAYGLAVPTGVAREGCGRCRFHAGDHHR